MNCRTAVLAGLATVALSSGCYGTVMNVALPPAPEGVRTRGHDEFPPGKRVYGGVRADVEMVAESLEAVRDPSNPKAGLDLLGLIILFDLPGSLIGDTITLPYTLAYAAWAALHAPPPSAPDTP
ncbi:YceK/YidQ family lipoprotein [bacterium]|nr:YceK/YidQ family lipoprotein [bacterium]